MSFFDRAAKYTLLLIGFSIPISTALVNMGFGFLLLCFLLSAIFHATWQAKWMAISRNPIVLLMLLLFILLGIGTLYSTADFHDAVNVWLKYRKLLCVLILVPFLQEAQWRRWALAAFLAAMMVTLFLSYAHVIRQLILHIPLTNANIFKSHIAQNILMAFTTYLLLHISLNTAIRPVWRWFAAIGSILAICNVLIFVQGRVGYIVLLVLLMLAAYQQLGLRGFFIGASSVLILFSSVFFLSSTFQYRVLHTYQEIERYQTKNEFTSAGTRLAFYKETLQLIQKNPVIGQGTGALSNAEVSNLCSKRLDFRQGSASVSNRSAHRVHEDCESSANTAENSSEKSIKMPNPHNEYLMLTVQIGLIGLSVFLYLLFQLWKQSYQLLPFDRKIAQGMILTFIVGCMFNSLLLDFTEGYWLVYFIAISYAHCRFSYTKKLAG